MKINNPDVAKAQYNRTNGKTKPKYKKSLSKELVKNEVKKNYVPPKTEIEKILSRSHMDVFKEIEEQFNCKYQEYVKVRDKYRREVSGTGDLLIWFRGIVKGVQSGSIDVKDGIEYAKNAYNEIARRVKMLHEDAAKRQSEVIAASRKNGDLKSGKKSVKKPNIISKIKKMFSLGLPTQEACINEDLTKRKSIEIIPHSDDDIFGAGR